MIELFAEKENCCGCEACVNRCPKNAISMEEDEYGFLYPAITRELCIECHCCEVVCPLKTETKFHEEAEVFIASSKDEKAKMKSSSGGLFFELAKQIVLDGGTVYGALYNQDWTLCHSEVKTVESLAALQGSKYVQSRIGIIYQNVKKELEKGNPVLFSGTPCQVDGIKKFLPKLYEKLFLVDIVCHGVPCQKMFKDFLNFTSKKENAVIKKIEFRDKTRGWGITGKFVMCTPSGKEKAKRTDGSNSAYYDYFLRSATYRDSCYDCKYANPKRVSDITLGDYWGAECEHPDFSRKVNLFYGVSAVMVNTDKGQALLDMISPNIFFEKSSIDKAKRRNGQLRRSTQKPDFYYTVMNQYRDKGYIGLNSYWKRTEFRRILINKGKELVPLKLKFLIKQNICKLER